MAGHHFTISAHDPSLDTDEEIAERVAFGNVVSREIFPEDPPTVLATAIAAEHSMPARLRRWTFRARDASGTIIASGGTRIDPEHDDNPDILQVNVHVHPDHRRHGVGAALLAELVALAEREGRTRLLTSTYEAIPGGEAMALAVGAEAKLREHVNHLPVDAVDRRLMERWVAEGPTRAPGYELVAFDGATPDELLEGVVSQVLVLNTAPRDDLEMNDFTLTPEMVREHDQQTLAAGNEQWTLLARHVESGAYAGMHDMTWHPDNPEVAWVGLTGVDPAHRGHALGKWLKATMTLRVLDERPQVTDIRTGNADSNEAMLGINREMGYRPLVGATAWELPVATARAWLAAKGVTAGAGSPV